DHEIGTVVRSAGTIEALVTVSVAKMDTGKIRVGPSRILWIAIKRIRRNNEPPISDTVSAIWLQQFRRVPPHRIAAISGGDHLDAVIYSGERPNLSVILRNNIPGPHRRKLIVHYRHDNVTTLQDRLRDKLLHQIFD